MAAAVKAVELLVGQQGRNPDTTASARKTQVKVNEAVKCEGETVEESVSNYTRELVQITEVKDNF